jgi:Na+/proline symporter
VTDGAPPLVVWVVVGSLAAVTAVGIWAGRRTRHAGDFFIAGQRLGLVVTALATMSAAFSGFVFLGGPGLTYRLGVASFFIVLPVGVTAAMLCWVVARPLRLLAGAQEIYTVPDVMRARFGGRWPAGLAAVAIVVGSVGYLGAQLQALGLVIDAVFGISGTLGAWGPAAAMAVGLALVLVYAVVGGMLAGVLTDVIQGGLMMVAAMAVFVVAWRATGGPVAMVDAIAGSPEFGTGFLDPLGGVPVATALGFFFVFSLGTLGQPHMLHKFFMLRDPRDLRWMPLAVAGSQSVCLLIWIGIGLAVPALVATGRMAPLAGPDDATPQFLLSVAPPLVAGFVFAGVMAAIMSTADSFVNVASAALVRDLPRALGIEVRRELPRARLAVALLLVGSAIFAGLYGDLIALLGTFAFGTFAAVLAPALAVGCNWSRVGRAAVVASMVVGLALNLGLELFVRFGGALGGLPPSAAALAGSLTVLLAVAWAKPGDGDLSSEAKDLLDL